MQGFRVPNNVFCSGLKHSQLLMYLYLLSIQRKGVVTATYSQLAEKLSVSPKTAFNAVQKLLSADLISRDYVCKHGKIVANRLQLTSLPNSSWVWVEKKLFELNLSSSELNVYLYIKCRANQAGRAWPPISRIHEDTNLAEQTVRKSINVLCAHSLLRRTRRTLLCGRPGHNDYKVIGMEERETILTLLRKKSPRPQAAAQAH